MYLMEILDLRREAGIDGLPKRKEVYQVEKNMRFLTFS